MSTDYIQNIVLKCTADYVNMWGTDGTFNGPTTCSNVND